MPTVHHCYLYDAFWTSGFDRVVLLKYEYTLPEAARICNLYLIYAQIALGTDYAGMWSSDEDLAKELTDVRSTRP